MNWIVYLLIDEYMLNLMHDRVLNVFIVNCYSIDNVGSPKVSFSKELINLDCAILFFYQQIRSINKEHNVATFHRHECAKHPFCVGYKPVTSKICGNMYAIFRYHQHYIERELLKYLWLDNHFF